MAIRKRILVVGAGVSGLTAAYWLKRHGFDPMVIDRAPAARPGADILHMFGPGYRIAEKMGLSGTIRGYDLNFKEVDFLDGNGSSIGTIGLERFREKMDNRICHLPRAALEASLLEKIASEIPVRYGKSIRRMERNPDGVSVLFEDHDWEAFDLVVGADGVDSEVRRQAFGWDSIFRKDCGYYAATCSIRGMHPGNRIVAYSAPGRMIGVFGRGSIASAFLIFNSQGESEPVKEELPARKQLFRERFAGMGRNVDRLLDALGRAPDFQSGPVCQIRMDKWGQNRVALVGDAAYCPSMLSGQGASLAMAGAYFLAGELKNSDGRPVPAFLGYESKMRGLIERKQEESLKVSLTPNSKFAYWIRRQIAAWLGFPMVLITVRQKLLFDNLELPEY